MIIVKKEKKKKGEEERKKGTHMKLIDRTGWER